MIRFRLAELLAEAQFQQGRKITVLELAEATGINRMTLSRMLNHKGYVTTTETVDRLCHYFKCAVGDVAVYVEGDPSVKEQAPSE